MVAPHLGMLAEAREGPDVEPNPKMEWWIHPKDRRIGQVIDWRMLVKRIHLTNSNLSQIPGKPQSIISLLISKIQLSIMLYILLH
jgi:hypothetical protein